MASTIIFGAVWYRLMGNNNAANEGSWIKGKAMKQEKLRIPTNTLVDI